MSTHESIRDFVVDNFLFGDEGGLKNDSSFLDEGIVDSTGILELVAYVEAEFGIRIADDELVPDNLDSIDRVASFIERKCGCLPPHLARPSLVNA